MQLQRARPPGETREGGVVLDCLAELWGVRRRAIDDWDPRVSRDRNVANRARCEQGPSWPAAVFLGAQAVRGSARRRAGRCVSRRASCRGGRGVARRASCCSAGPRGVGAAAVLLGARAVAPGLAAVLLGARAVAPRARGSGRRRCCSAREVLLRGPARRPAAVLLGARAVAPGPARRPAAVGT